jgi:hypothetical protein
MRLQLYAIAITAALLVEACASTAAPPPVSAASPKAAAAPAPGSPSAVAPSEAFVSRAEAFVTAFNSKTPVSALFVTDLTEEQRRGLANADAMMIRMRDRLGPIIGIDRIEAETPYKGSVHVNMESRQASFRIGIEPEPPHRIRGMALGK